MSTDVHTLSGAYALDALSPEEAVEFRRHLDGCQACRDEVRELQRAAARLGSAEAATPPPELRARILAAAGRTPQQPPAPAANTGTGVGTDRETGGETGRKTDREPAAAEREQRRRWPAWLAAAAAAVVVAGGGIVGLQAMDDDEPSLPVAVTEVFEAEDARTATVPTENGGKLTVGVSASRDEMAVDVRDLPELDEGRVYQIWSVDGEEIVSAGIVKDPDDGGAAMGMPEEGTKVALTVEPGEGSEQPTTAPIVQVDPRSV